MATDPGVRTDSHSVMHLSHMDHGEDGSEWADSMLGGIAENLRARLDEVDGSEWADSVFGGIAENMRARLDEVEVSEQEWQRRHEKRTFQIALSKSTPWYEPMAFLRMQGVYENAPRTPNAYDRWISKRKWEVEFMNWRHRVNEKSTTFAAWKWEWKLAKALKHNAEKCGLGGRGTQQVLAHQHMREWDKTNDKWHEHHRIQQACAKAKPRLHIEHPPRPKAVKFATGRLLLAPRPEFIEKDH